MKVGYFSRSLCVINIDFSFGNVFAKFIRDQSLHLILKFIELILISELVGYKKVSDHFFFVGLAIVFTL